MNSEPLLETMPFPAATIKLVTFANSPTKPMVTSSLTPVVKVSNKRVSKVMPVSSTVQLKSNWANNDLL